jgi:hypothetical protein
MLAALSAREQSMGTRDSSTPSPILSRSAASAAKPDAFVRAKKGSRNAAAAVKQSPGKSDNSVTLALADTARGKKNGVPESKKAVASENSRKSTKMSASRGVTRQAEAAGVRLQAGKTGGPPTGKKFARPRGR